MEDREEFYVEELEVVQWYIEVFEDGKNTRNLLKHYIEAQAELRVVKDKIKTVKEKYQGKVKGEKERVQEHLDKLVEM